MDVDTIRRRGGRTLTRRDTGNRKHSGSVDDGEQSALNQLHQEEAQHTDGASSKLVARVAHENGQEDKNGNAEEILWSWMSLSSTRSGWKKWKLILPCYLPERDASLGLLLSMIGCLLALAIDRAINIVMPIANKWVINSLTATEQSKGQVPPNWWLMLGYILLNTLHGPGLLGPIRSALWLRVSQYTTKKLKVKLFDKVMSQSLRWHILKKTGELNTKMDRGISSVNSIVNQMLFNLIPAVFDVCVAVLFFLSAFDFLTGLIVFGSMVGYLLSVIFLGKKRRAYQKEQREARGEMNTVLFEALANFETVKTHAAEGLESERYASAIEDVQEAETKTNVSVATVQISQRAMKNLGLLGGSLLCALRVSEGTFTVGDYMLFVTYLSQVYGPLNTFGGYLRTMQQNLSDMEGLFEILHEVPEIEDEEGADDLVVKEGRIEFQDVNFHYNPEKEILKGVSFTVEPGKSVALVGGSGSGKTTVTRMLLRFFEPQAGSILIDGIDISKVTQKSLREQVSIVSQDTALFNRDIEYNIRYGKPGASCEEVEGAAKDASIHERILSFPEKYETKVGERGLKVSGGEKQRIAIARALLKDSPIMILDEATSSLDTNTERQIQDTLIQAYSSKTTLIVAHRLSTIKHADLILVFKDGEIVERGNHSELLEMGGLYFNLCSKQHVGTSEGLLGDVSDSEARSPKSSRENSDSEDIGDKSPSKGELTAHALSRVRHRKPAQRQDLENVGGLDNTTENLVLQED